MNTGHVWYDQDSEPSKSVKVRDVGTPGLCRNSRLSELSTYVGTPDEPTREQQLYHYWPNTGHVQYCQTRKNRLALLSLKTLKTHMGWLEHL